MSQPQKMTILFYVLALSLANVTANSLATVDIQTTNATTKTTTVNIAKSIGSSSLGTVKPVAIIIDSNSTKLTLQVSNSDKSHDNLTLDRSTEHHNGHESKTKVNPDPVIVDNTTISREELLRKYGTEASFGDDDDEEEEEEDDEEDDEEEEEYEEGEDGDEEEDDDDEEEEQEEEDSAEVKDRNSEENEVDSDEEEEEEDEYDEDEDDDNGDEDEDDEEKDEKDDLDLKHNTVLNQLDIEKNGVWNFSLGDEEEDRHSTSKSTNLIKK